MSDRRAVVSNQAAAQRPAELDARNLTVGFLTLAFGAIVGALIANGHDINELRRLLASAIAAHVQTPQRPPRDEAAGDDEG